MATTNSTNRRVDGARPGRAFRRFHAVIIAAVEGVALLLRLPLVVHIVMSVITELAIALICRRRRSR